MSLTYKINIIYKNIPIIIRNNSCYYQHTHILSSNCDIFPHSDYSKTTTTADISLKYWRNPINSNFIGKESYDYQLEISIYPLKKDYKIKGSIEKENLDHMLLNFEKILCSNIGNNNKIVYLEIHLDYDITNIKSSYFSNLVEVHQYTFQLYNENENSRSLFMKSQIHNFKEILYDSHLYKIKYYSLNHPIEIETFIDYRQSSKKIKISLNKDLFSIFVKDIGTSKTSIFYSSSMKQNHHRITFILQALHQPMAVINYEEANQIITITHPFIELVISHSDITINYRKPINKTRTIDLEFLHLSQDSSVEKSEEELLAQQWQSVEDTAKNLAIQLDTSLSTLENTFENHDLIPSQETIKDTGDLKSSESKDNPEIKVELNSEHLKANHTIDTFNNFLLSKNLLGTTV